MRMSRKEEEDFSVSWLVCEREKAVVRDPLKKRMEVAEESIRK